MEQSRVKVNSISDWQMQLVIYLLHRISVPPDQQST